MPILEDIYNRLHYDGAVKRSYEEFKKDFEAQGERGYKFRNGVFRTIKDMQKEGFSDYDALAPEGTYEEWWRARSAGYRQQKQREQMKNKARENSPVPRQQKPAATPQGQKPKPVQQPTPNKPDSVSQQYMPKDIPDPTASTGKYSRVRPKQGTGVLKTDAQIMADPTLSAEDKVALINDNRRRRGQRQRTFNGPAYEETARNMGVVADNPVEGFTESVEAGFQPDPFFTDTEGNVLGYKPNYVNKSPVTEYNDRIKEIADEINYYNTKQDQGGGATTRIEDAINNAYAKFVQADDERMNGSFWNRVARAMSQSEDGGIQDAIERGSLREKYAGLDAVAEAAYNSFPDEVKQKYGEDAVYNAIYQATLSAMQENARPKNFGEYLGRKLTNMVPGLLYKGAVRANAGGRTTLSDIGDMATSQYEEGLEGFGGTVQKIAGEVLPMAFDPTMYIPIGGAAGNLVGRGIKHAAVKRAAAKGLESGATKLAGQAALSTFAGRGAVGAASTAAQMTAYEEALGLANMANGSGQDFWDVTGEALLSGVKMAPIGFIGPAARVIKGRTATAIADKGLSRGAQWAANTAAKLGISTGAFMTEAGVFAAPDLIGMAFNGTYTNEQAKDIVAHSIATLAGFKVAGVFNPAHIGQTAQQFKSIVKGTMGTELALDRHDSEALERLGYPKIQGDNIMSLFMPLGERPEAREGGGYFSMYSQIVKDERVPWSTRAKLIYVATGMLPETGVRPNRVKYTTDENGRIVVTTLQGNNPISQRFFDKKHEASARSYHRKVDHDVERMLYEGAKQDIITENTGGMGRSKLLNDALAKKPSERTPAEMSLIDAYEASVREAMEIAEMARDIAMQGGFPDPEKALKKSKFDRTEEEKSSVERYWRYLNRYIDELRRDNYEPIARDMAQRRSEEAAEEMSNIDGKLYLCQLRDEPADTWYTVVDFDGTIERDETGMRINLGPNGDKMMVRNMATGETKLVSRNDIVQIGLDEREGVRSWLEEQMFANTLNSLVDNRRRASMYPAQPQVAEVGERLTLAADNVDQTTGLRPEYTVINKDGKSGTYIVEDAQGNRKLINGHDILQKITDAEPQIPAQIAPQVPPTGPQTPPPAAPQGGEQPQGEGPAMPEQGDVFKLKVGDEFKDAEVIGKDDTGIIVRYEDNGGYKTEHLTPEELAPRLEQQEAPAAPVTPTAQGEGASAAPETPQDGIPRDESGNRLYHKLDQKAVEEHLKGRGLDDEDIMAIADSNINKAQKDLDDANTALAEARASGNEDGIVLAKASRKDAQERLDWWNTFKEGYGKEEQPAGGQPPVVEGGGQPPVQEDASDDADINQLFSELSENGQYLALKVPKGERRDKYIEDAYKREKGLDGEIRVNKIHERRWAEANKDSEDLATRIAARKHLALGQPGTEAEVSDVKKRIERAISKGTGVHSDMDGYYWMDGPAEEMAIYRQAMKELGYETDNGEYNGGRYLYFKPKGEGEGEGDVPRDWHDDVPAEARKRGYIMDGAGGKIMRQDPFEEPKGNTTQVNFGGKTGVVEARYDIVESETVQESHVNGQENPLHFFIREAQPKERTDRASQRAANATANNIRPVEITSGATAYSGAPVVNTRREVIQGNGRENALHNAYANGTAEEYRQYLIDHAEEWGLDPEVVRNMRRPQLVRVIDVPDERAIELGLMDDKDIGTGGKQFVDPKTLIAKIDTDLFNRLMQAAFEGMKEDDSFADALRQNGKNILDLLIANNLINETQLQGLMNADGTLTKDGRNTLTEMVLMPLFDGAPASLRPKWDSPAIPERAKTALIRTLGRLSRIEDKSVIEDIRKAVSLLYEMRDVRDANTWKKFVHRFNEWGGQVDIQHPEPIGKDYTPEQVRMAGAIKFVAQNKLTGFFGDIYSKMFQEPGTIRYEPVLPKPEAYKEAFDAISDILTPEEIKDFSAKPEGGQAEQGERPAGSSGRGEGPATPPTPPAKPETPQEPQGGGEPPKGEGEPPKPEEPGKPAGEPAGGPATPPSGERHQLTVDEINGLNLSQSTKENAIDYINGDRGPRATNAYETALKEWERVNGKSGEGKPETPPAAPEGNGPQEPPKGGGSGTTGRGGGRRSAPRSGSKPAEPKPAEPKPEGEGPKDSSGLDFSGLDELGEFEGLFGDSDVNESRRPAREDGLVSDTNEARYIPNKATAEQNRAVEKVVEVLAGIGKQLLEKRGMRTQSELVDFMRRNDEAKKIREALDKIGFDDEDKSNLFDDMWGQRVDTPWEAPRNRMRLSEYADELSKSDKPKQDDKPKQIVSPMEPTVKNIVYQPNSKGKTNESIIPASMAQAVKTALGKINGGDTDGFVMDKVGFKDKDELYGALNAEQIDGVALAISAIERGEGLILGDMTGIGKGRQLAAVIRYARKEGIRPVFVTEKPGLFKDMMRDLLDVGADTPNKPFRPLILASAGNGDVTLADGSTVKAADAETIEKLLSGDLDKLAKGYDALFVTYANTNNVESAAFIADQEARRKTKTHNENTETREPPELTKKKLNLIAKWARGSIVVMDEAHNAAGTDSNQAVQWREIIDTKSGVNAKGVVMASATYAKTPKNYVLYALRTPIKEAHLSNNQLEEVFAKGGVPLQEWLAGQLTGESYIRRERDMTGVNFDYRICVDGYDAEHPENSTPEALEKVKAIRKSNDQAAKIANTLLALDNLANEEFKKIKDALAPSEKSGKAPMAVTVLVQQADGTYKEQTIDPRNYPEKLKVTTSSFATQIAGVNAQLFMAEKADSAADAAIKALENGELPMIVFENTFDSLMEEIPVDERGVLESADYAQAFVRYLDRLGNFKVKLPKYNANGAQEVYNCRIDLSSNPDFVRVKRMIENEGVGLHVSPVDRIRERLEAAGYKVGELSGRKNSIQKLADGKYHKVKRKTEDPDKITDDYNTGKIDVLLINASGSTGRSMHEKGTWSEDGKEKIPGTTQSGEKILMKPRHQIYVQNFSNETTMVQAMGRIDRTGQVEHGLYTFLMTPVPAETNILMRAQRKREQLKANTTAQQDRNSFDAVNASDFINKYGDEVVAEYLEDNPRTLSALQLKKEDLREGTGKAKSGLAKKATANAYTLTCEQQQEFYDEVQAAYDEYVRVLKENGDYDLETQVADLQAETIAEHMFVRGSHESDSMFSQDTNIARCRVKILRRPLKVEDIDQHVNEVTGTDKESEHQEKYQEKFDKHFADMEAEVEKEFEDKEQNVENDGKKNDKLGKIRAFKLEAQRVVNDFPLGLLMPFFSDTSEAEGGQGKIVTESMPHAIVYDVKLGRTLNSSTVIFAVNDGRQKVAVRMNDDATLKYLRRLQITPGEKFDRSEWNKSQGDSYEDAFIITGNLIGAYHSPIASRGRMIRYTDSEGNVHTGILMPRNFKTKDVVVDKPISEFANQLMQFAKYGPSTISLPVFAKGELEAEETRYSNVVRFVAKGELAKRFAGDTDLATYRTGKTTNKYEVTGRDSLQKVLGIFAGRYGVSASVPIDPAHFMTREERDKEAESRMFRVNENIEETAPSTRSRYYNTPYVVHVPKERRKNVDATSDWLDKIIEKLNDNGYYGNYDTLRTIEGGRRVYSEFHFQNKKMAEEFIKMVNEEPVRPLAVDEMVEAAEPHWEEVDRSQHTYHIAGESEPLIGDDIASTFGFRNVDTGSLGHDGIRDLYNAFMTMAMILNIHPKSISLGGNMDMNMLDPGAAAREMGDGVTAHFRVSGKANSYTGGTQKKMQFRAGESAFPLAHEWLHALDNYFGTFGLKNEETGFYEQTRKASESADRPNRPWTAREEMREAWYGLIRSLVESGFYGRLENEHFFKGSNFTDSSNRPMYWGKRTEMLARAFEAYMRKKITENEDNLRIVTGNSTTGRKPTPSDNYVVLNNRPTMFYSMDGHLEYESEIRKYCNAHGIQFDGVENALLDITGREGGYGLPTNADSIKRLKAYLGEDRAIDLLKSIGIDGEVRMDGLFYSFDGESSSIAQRMRDMIADGSINTSGEFDPTPKEQAVIDKAFDKFFETIREKRDVDTGRFTMFEQAKPGETKREATMRETRNLNRVLARTGLANSVTVESERDFAEGVFANTGRPLRTLDGIVYGYTDSEGNIHLNAKYLNFETPIHEYGHLWTAWAKKNHGDLWQRGIELAKESDAFKRLKEESKKKGSVYNGMTDDQLADEVLADAIGKKGQDMYDPKDWTRTARVRHWLTQLWHRIGEALGFRKRMRDMAVGDMSFDDIIRTAAGDILSGKRMKGAKGKGKVNFASKGSVPTFYSNAAKAVDGIKQEKATGEQWLAMLRKNGGLKAEEDKWMGLSEWLNEPPKAIPTEEDVAEARQDFLDKYTRVKDGELIYNARGTKELPGYSIEEEMAEYVEREAPKIHERKFGLPKKRIITKQEIQDFIRENQVQVADANYAEMDYWDRRPDGVYENPSFDYEIRPVEDEDFGRVFSIYDKNGNIEHLIGNAGEDKFTNVTDAASYVETILEPNVDRIHNTRLQFTTKGLKNNREIALVVPTVAPYNESDKVHFGDAGGGRAVAWVRFGDANAYEGGNTDNNLNTYREIDELERRVNDLEESLSRNVFGARRKRLEEDLAKAEEQLTELYSRKYAGKRYKVLVIDEIQSKRHQDARKYGYRSEWDNIVTKVSDATGFSKQQVDENPYDVANWMDAHAKGDEGRKLAKQLRDAFDKGVPDAPFVKNWHELAMKRMLRYAAENGYDKIAWTTGMQQASRYNIGKVIGQISRTQTFNTGETRFDLMPKDNSGSISLFVKDGIVTRSARDEFAGMPLTDVVGKEVAQKMLEMPDHSNFDIADMDIGGEGMKGFYDDMLPRFMDKYGKKWGVKTGTVELDLPNEGDWVMHSIDVTPEMRESVITQGQPLFQQGRNEQIDRYPNGEIKEVRNYDDDGNLRRLLRYDEKRQLVRHYQTDIGTDWELDENGIARGMSNGVEMKPYNFRFQQVAEPVKQAISSADTSLNQVASGLRSAPLQPGTTNFDLGGGRFDKGTEYLAEKGVENVVFDPFNRDAEHNQKAFEIVKNGGFDSVTCNNVLNVIAEPEVRSNVILQAAKALKQGGTAYFTVYEGSGNGEGKETSKGWQNNRKTADYMEEIGQHFGNVERKGKLIIAKDPITDGKADWFMDAKQEEPIRFQAGSPIGNNEQLHIARDYAQDRTRANTRLYEEMVENTVSLRHVLEDIARKSGKPIADYENVYLAENQSHGMMTTELITFRDRRVQPLLDQLRKLAKNYGGEPTKNYVWARHGIERSIYICFRERAYELAEAEAEAAARARGEEVTDQDINDAYNAMLDELYNATSGYSRRAYLENLETECSNILSAHGNTEPFEVTDKAGLTALNDKRSLVDDSPIENAWEIVKEYENNAGTEGEADVEALFDRLNDISKSMLDYSRDKGMMDKATVEKIRKMFRFYVPLQGFAEGTMAQDYFEYVDSNPMRAGRAVPNTPKMRGRGSESADPIATLVRNAEMTIAAARRNTVATHLYNLATSRDTDLFAPARAWEAYDAAEDTWVPSTPDFTGCETTKDMMDAIRLHDEQMRQQRELGLAREARRGFSNRLITAQGAPKGLKMSMRQRHEHAVPVRINGKENVIYVLSDPRIAQIVNGTDKGSVDKSNAPFFYQANKLKRIQSGLMTSYNIAFWFANGARDIQNAFLRQAIMNGGGAAARTATQGLKGDPFGIIPWEAMKLYNKAVKGTLDESDKHERYFKEFFEHGGITGYAFADQVEKIQSRVKKLLEHPKTNPRRLMFAVGELMEKAGGAFEIAPRFATYVASRDGGKSVMQSVADAKEATVNFDRRGARRSWAMRAAAAFYAFLNPGIQGMQNRLHQVRTHPNKTTLLHAAGFAMGYLWKGVAVACLASLGRKDDEYDTQLTEYDRRNNICIPVGDDDWVKIPIDMEDRVLFGLGDAVRNGMDFFPGNRYIGGEGKDDYDDNEDWMKYAGIVSAWFPIDIGSENNFIPTSLQPVYDIYINKKDFRGNAVDWRNERNAQDPEYQRVNPYVTGKTWTAASKWWSEFNGGNEVVRAQNRSMHGWDEINPQHMQYLFQSYLGGLGTTVGQVMSLVETLASDEPDKKFSSFKFPIANRFWKGNLNEYSSTKDERNKARVWTNWADEIIRRDREYRKRGAEYDDENNTLSNSAREDYEDNLRYLQLAKEIKSQKDKKSNAKKKATKEGRKLTEEEEREFDNAMWERINEFEQKFLEIDGKRKVPEWRKHYDDD